MYAHHHTGSLGQRPLGCGLLAPGRPRPTHWLGSNGVARSAQRLGCSLQPARCGGPPALPRCGHGTSRSIGSRASSSGSSSIGSSRHRPQQQQRQRQRHVARASLEVWPRLEQRSKQSYINELNRLHGAEGYFEFYEVAGSGQPAAYLMHPRGHTLEVQLQGATITRWIKPDGEDLLYVRPDAVLEEGEAINSGIPLAFPQWRDGPLPFHGFADKMEWEVVGTDFDCEFVNIDVERDELAEGDAMLLVDDEGQSLVPPPLGLLDEEDVRGQLEGADLDAGIDAMYEQEAQEQQEAAAAAAAAAAAKPKKGRRKAAPAAAAAAAAAEEQAAAAEQAGSGAGAAAADAAAEAAQQQQQQEAAEAAAAGEAEGAAGDEEGGDDEGGDDIMDDVDYGIVEDPAPCIILKLSDTEETRAIWPHAFELYYKITLMETDDFPDPSEGLPRGLHPYRGSDALLGPREAALLALAQDEDEEVAAAAAEEMAESFRASNVLAGLHGTAVVTDREAQLDHPLPGQASYTGQRLYTDMDGPIEEDEEDDDDDYDDDDDVTDGGEEPSSGGRGGGRVLRGAAKSSAAAKRAKAAAAAAAAAGAEDADTGEGEEEEDEEEGGVLDPASDLPPGMYDNEEPPMQIRLEWRLINKDPEGSPPMSFQLGALSHFRTEDQAKHGEFVRILGLGGVTTYDWSEDPRRARLRGNDEDYIVFDGTRHDAVYIGSHDADVSFCPGDRTHFELMAREGLPDHVVWHPGAWGRPGIETASRFFAQVGAGRLALPKKLAPGEMWKGEYVIRYHERYWDPPFFDRDSAQPMPRLVPQRDDADDREEWDDENIVEGVQGSSLGGGPNVPSMTE